MTETTSDLLRNIQRSLDEIRAILTLVNREKLEQAKGSLLKEGSVKLQIFNLCDGIRTTKDIVKTIQKDSSYVHSYLSILRREGLIRTVEKEGNVVHEQIF